MDTSKRLGGCTVSHVLKGEGWGEGGHQATGLSENQKKPELSTHHMEAAALDLQQSSLDEKKFLCVKAPEILDYFATENSRSLILSIQLALVITVKGDKRRKPTIAIAFPY